MMTEAEMKVMYLQAKDAKDCWQTPEGKRGNKGFSLTGFRSMAL